MKSVYRIFLIIFLIVVNVYGILQYTLASVDLFEIQRAPNPIDIPINIFIISLLKSIIVLAVMILSIKAISRVDLSLIPYIIGLIFTSVNILILTYCIIMDISMAEERVYIFYTVIQGTIIWLTNFSMAIFYLIKLKNVQLTKK